MYTIEEKKKFSESKIWSLQREYYDNKGIEAWRSGEVPHYVTSNPVVGKTYAELVLAFLRDLSLINQTKETVYLLELGAGHGRLCYHFFKHFEKYYESSAIDLPPFCYVLSDFTESNISFWKEHPRLRPYIDKGWIDVAQFDVEKDQEIELHYKKKRLEVNSLTQPLIVVANYFFDSIPQELYKVKDGVLQDGLLKLTSEANPEKIAIPDLLPSMDLNYSYQIRDIGEEQPSIQRLLGLYKEELNNTHFLFPHIGIECIGRLRKLSQQGLLLLTADKGHHHLSSLENTEPPELSTHGSFSLTVNYHAFKEYCIGEKGMALFPLHQHMRLDLGCMLFLENAVLYKETKNAYQRFVNDYGPDDYYIQKKFVEKYFNELSYQDIFATLRLSGYDARIFLQMYPQLLKEADTLKENDRWSLFQTIHRVWDTYYPLGEDENLPFALGNLLFKLKFYREAIVYFDLCLKIYGQSAPTLYNIALCYCLLDEYSNAVPIIDALKKHNPENSKLKDLEEIFGKPVTG